VVTRSNVQNALLLIDGGRGPDTCARGTDALPPVPAYVRCFGMIIDRVRMPQGFTASRIKSQDAPAKRAADVLGRNGGYFLEGCHGNVKALVVVNGRACNHCGRVGIGMHLPDRRAIRRVDRVNAASKVAEEG